MAQATGSVLELCLKTEELLRGVSGQITPENIRVRPLGTFHAIQDSMREGIVGINQLLMGKQIAKSTTNAADRIVQLNYWKPDCGAVAQCSAIDFDDCENVSDAVNTYAVDQFYPSSCVAGAFAIDPDNYTVTCTDTVLDFRRKLEQEVRKMMKSENDILAAQLAAAVGNYASLSGAATVDSAANPKTLNLLSDTAPVHPQPLAWYPLHREYEDMGITDRTPYVVGGSLYFRSFNWANDVGIFAGNVDGWDPNKQISLNGYVDRRFDTTLTAAGVAGQDRIISFVAGSVANINWFKYETPMLESAIAAIGSERTVYAPLQNSGTIVRQKVDVGSVLFGSPYEVDMFIQYNECTNKINVRMKRYYDLWHIPDDAFVAACDQAHNYLLLWSTDSGDLSAANVVQ